MWIIAVFLGEVKIILISIWSNVFLHSLPAPNAVNFRNSKVPVYSCCLRFSTECLSGVVTEQKWSPWTRGSIYLSVRTCVKPGKRVVFSCFLNIPIPEVFDWSRALSDQKTRRADGNESRFVTACQSQPPPHTLWAAYILHGLVFSLQENNCKNI